MVVNRFAAWLVWLVIDSMSTPPGPQRKLCTVPAGIWMNEPTVAASVVPLQLNSTLPAKM